MAARRTRSRPILMAVLLVAVSLLCPLTALADDSQAGRGTAWGGRPPAIDAQDLEPFMDGLMAAQMQSDHIPGAAVSVVRDGKVVFAKGYGYADLARQIPVAADRTLFRPASVSKLFVWTAVMQLAEQGKLDLHADVNRYLTGFQIPATFPRPVTLADLMTHSAGFEERAIGEAVGSAADLKPVQEYLAAHLPARVRPPGQITAYSNYGASLAGYIVSQVSGMPFEQYVEANIFGPLGMSSSSFRQPLPADLAANMAVGYSFEQGAIQPHPFFFEQSAPAGGLSTTATDLAKFMIAQLQDGRLGDRRILQESTAQAMHRQSFTNDARVNGIANGFMVATINNQRLIWHGGDLYQFHSALVLLPDKNVGFYVSYNSENSQFTVYKTMQAFMDRYYPAKAQVPAAPAGLPGSAAQYAGSYMPARHEYTTMGKLMGLVASVQVTPAGAHQVKVSYGFPAQLVSHYAEVEPGLFASTDLPPSFFGNILFRSEGEGGSGAKYLLQGNNPTTAYIKLPWYAAPGTAFGLLGISLVIFLSVIGRVPVGAWIKRRFGRVEPLPARLASWALALFSGLSLAFVGGFVLMFSSHETLYGLPGWAHGLFTLPWILAALLACLLYFTVAGWIRRYWSVPGRIYYTLVTAAAVNFLWWITVWNLWLVRA